MFELDNRVALVTGAARGLGREIATALSLQGAEVFATDLDPLPFEKSGSEPSSRIRSLVLDVTSPDSWEAAVSEIQQTFGKLDILVNNAGVMESRSFLDTSLEDFRRTQRINSESVFIGVKAAYTLLLKGANDNPAGASIINISSTLGQLGGDMNTAYCASKGAVRMLTKAMAVELGRAGTGIRVNSVHPGGIDTALGRSGLQAFVDSGAIPDMGAAENMLVMLTPMGRFAKVDDIAGAVVFLASDASRFMTGSELTVDGGFSIV